MLYFIKKLFYLIILIIFLFIINFNIVFCEDYSENEPDLWDYTDDNFYEDIDPDNKDFDWTRVDYTKVQWVKVDDYSDVDFSKIPDLEWGSGNIDQSKILGLKVGEIPSKYFDPTSIKESELIFAIEEQIRENLGNFENLAMLDHNEFFKVFSNEPFNADINVINAENFKYDENSGELIIVSTNLGETRNMHFNPTQYPKDKYSILIEGDKVRIVSLDNTDNQINSVMEIANVESFERLEDGSFKINSLDNSNIHAEGEYFGKIVMSDGTIFDLSTEKGFQFLNDKLIVEGGSADLYTSKEEHKIHIDGSFEYDKGKIVLASFEGKQSSLLDLQRELYIETVGSNLYFFLEDNTNLNIDENYVSFDDGKLIGNGEFMLKYNDVEVFSKNKQNFFEYNKDYSFSAIGEIDIDTEDYFYRGLRTDSEIVRSFEDSKEVFDITGSNEGEIAKFVKKIKVSQMNSEGLNMDNLGLSFTVINQDGIVSVVPDHNTIGHLTEISRKDGSNIFLNRETILRTDNSQLEILFGGGINYKKSNGEEINFLQASKVQQYLGNEKTGFMIANIVISSNKNREEILKTLSNLIDERSDLTEKGQIEIAKYLFEKENGLDFTNYNIGDMFYDISPSISNDNSNLDDLITYEIVDIDENVGVITLDNGEGIIKKYYIPGREPENIEDRKYSVIQSTMYKLSSQIGDEVLIDINTGETARIESITRNRESKVLEYVLSNGKIISADSIEERKWLASLNDKYNNPQILAEATYELGNFYLNRDVNTALGFYRDATHSLTDSDVDDNAIDMYNRINSLRLLNLAKLELDLNRQEALSRHDIARTVWSEDFESPCSSVDIGGALSVMCAGQQVINTFNPMLIGRDLLWREGKVEDIEDTFNGKKRVIELVQNEIDSGRATTIDQAIANLDLNNMNLEYIPKVFEELTYDMQFNNVRDYGFVRERIEQLKEEEKYLLAAELAKDMAYNANTPEDRIWGMQEYRDIADPMNEWFVFQDESFSSSNMYDFGSEFAPDVVGAVFSGGSYLVAKNAAKFSFRNEDMVSNLINTGDTIVGSESRIINREIITRSGHKLVLPNDLFTQSRLILDPKYDDTTIVFRDEILSSSAEEFKRKVIPGTSNTNLNEIFDNSGIFSKEVVYVDPSTKRLRQIFTIDELGNGINFEKLRSFGEITEQTEDSFVFVNSEGTETLFLIDALDVPEEINKYTISKKEIYGLFRSREISRINEGFSHLRDGESISEVIPVVKRDSSVEIYDVELDSVTRDRNVIHFDSSSTKHHLDFNNKDFSRVYMEVERKADEILEKHLDSAEPIEYSQKLANAEEEMLSMVMEIIQEEVPYRHDYNRYLGGVESSYPGLINKPSIVDNINSEYGYSVEVAGACLGGKGGVCRHQGILTSGIVSELIRNGRIREGSKSYYDYGNYHAWSVTRISDGKGGFKEIIIDPAQNNIGDIRDSNLKYLGRNVNREDEFFNYDRSLRNMGETY